MSAPSPSPESAAFPGAAPSGAMAYAQLLPRVRALLQAAEAVRLGTLEPEFSRAAWRAQWEPLLAAPAGSALSRLAGHVGFGYEHAVILALAAAPYLDPEVRVSLQALQGSALADRCTVGLALEILYEPGPDRVAGQALFDDDAAVFRHGLVTVETSPHARGDALVERVLCVPQRTVDLLLGRLRLDAEVRRFCVLEETETSMDRVILPGARKDELLALVRHHDRYRSLSTRYGFDRAVPYGRGITILFAGPSGTGKTLCARALAADFRRPLLRVWSDKLAEAGDALEGVVTSLLRDARLFSAIVFFDECESLFQRKGAGLGILLAALERHDGLVILATNAPQAMDAAMDRRIVHRLDFEPPDANEREQIWELHLPPDAPVASDVDVSLLASVYELTGAAIKNAVVVALNRAIDASPDAPQLTMALLRVAAEAQLKCNLEDFAQRIRSPLRLADVVLPPDERVKLQEVLDACRNREFVLNRWGFGKRSTTGRGIGVLFDGPPGTGKTLSAEVLARELDRPLYRVHVPNVVSKWVGETEKNIAEIFSRARATQAILLFDEADSLFGKRTEVKSANDRFANQEVNLLLQEIERYEGVVILTTNLFGSLDEALKRRIQYRITFPFPTAAERARIWEALVPAAAPVAADVDYAALGKAFELAGGNIKNAILRAAYRACAAGARIGMAHLREAGRLECEAMGLAVREAQPPRAPRPPEVSRPG